MCYCPLYSWILTLQELSMILLRALVACWSEIFLPKYPAIHCFSFRTETSDLICSPYLIHIWWHLHLPPCSIPVYPVKVKLNTSSFLVQVPLDIIYINYIPDCRTLIQKLRFSLHHTHSYLWRSLSMYCPPSLPHMNWSGSLGWYFLKFGLYADPFSFHTICKLCHGDLGIYVLINWPRPGVFE